MSADPSTGIDVDELLARIRAEVERRRGSAASADQAAGGGRALDVHIPRFASAKAPQARSGDRTLHELLALDDADFLEAAYAAALGRGPDEAGQRHFLDALRSGRLSKVEVVGRLRYSPEGRAKRRRIRGLAIPFAWRSAYRIPGLGYAFALANFLLRLPTVVRNVEAFENNSRWRLRSIERHLDEQGGVLESGFQNTRITLEEATRRTQLRGERLANEIGSLREALASLGDQELGPLKAALDQLDSRMQHAAVEAEQTKSLTLELTHRLRSEHEAIRAATERVAEVPRLSAALVELGQGVAEVPRLGAALAQMHDRVADVPRLSAALADLHERVARVPALNASLAELQERVVQLETSARVDEINVRVVQLEQQKADALALIRLEERVGMIAGSLLDRTALDAHLRQIEDRLAAKAGQADLLALAERFASIAERKADSVSVELLRAEIDGKLARGADGEAMRTAIARLERHLDDVRLAVRAQRTTSTDVVASPQGLARTKADARARRMQSFDEDSFYVDLETAFRGTRHEVRQRAETFLAVVAGAQAGSDAAPILDLGCGRGEWLELLQERGLRAAGVDLNPLFVDACRERALAVTQQDALAALRGAADQSLGAVTAFHLVEHLPLEQMIALIDESRRALKPGGVMILETPNPENLSVGACNFYLDPTHRNPIPPALLEFLAQSRGFTSVEVRRLYEHRVVDPFGTLPESITQVPQLELAIGLLRQAYYSAPDYAIVAFTG